MRRKLLQQAERRALARMLDTDLPPRPIASLVHVRRGSVRQRYNVAMV